MAGFTFVGRESELAAFRELVERPEGELLLITGPQGGGKSHLLRRLRREAEAMGRHFVLFGELDSLPDADLRHYSIIISLMRIHRSGRLYDGIPSGTRLFVKSGEFLDSLLSDERRPPCERLLRGLSVTAETLDPEARLLVLLDLGRLDDPDAFPVEFYARHLPGRIKLVVAKPSAPAGLAELDGVTVLPPLPPLTEAEAAQVFEFHLSEEASSAELGAAAWKASGGLALSVDVAAKIAASAADPAHEVASLPAGPGPLCRSLVESLDDAQRDLAACVARVPLGVGIGLLRALTDLPDSKLSQIIRSDGMRNVLITQRAPDGVHARIFHEAFAEAVLAAVPDDPARTRAFHKRTAAFFLGMVEQDPTHLEALSAHAHHLRLSEDKRQFIADFAKTYKAKHSFHLLPHLAEEYERLIRFCDELGESGINLPACLANLGRVRQELDQYERAIERYREALELYEEQNDTAGAAEQYANLASAHQALGQMNEAIEELEEAAKLDEQAGNQAGLAADWNNLGILCQQLGQPERALQYHQRALGLHEGLNSDIGRANQLANMAAIHRQLGNLDEARDCYQRAWRLDARVSPTPAQVADLCNLGLVFDDLGEIDKAISCYEQAIELDRMTADRDSEAEHLRTVATLVHKRGQHDEAIKTLHQALQIHRALGSRSGEIGDLLVLGDVCRDADDLPLARDMFEEAARLCAEIGDEEAGGKARRALEETRRQLAGDGPPDGAGEPTPATESLSPVATAGAEPTEDTPSEPAAATPSDPAAEGEGAEPPPPDQASSEALDEALRRVAELETQLKDHKQAVERFRNANGEEPPSE